MDDDPGLAGLSPEFQAMLGGLAGHTKAFAQLLEKRSGSSKEEKEKDDEVYLESYADLAIHEEMLKDYERVRAYRSAIEYHASGWQNATVVDVGAGTGLLSVFCARVAKKVIAVEASRLSHFLKQVARKNAAHIEVHECLAEELKLDEKVDVIVSEWMGYCLLFENMLPSVLAVRDAHLKPGGLMLPSACRLFLAPIEDGAWRRDKVDFWQSVHGIDMSCLVALAKSSFCGTPQHRLVPPEALLGPGSCIFEADLHSLRPEELENVESALRVAVPAQRRLDGFVAWFECDLGATTLSTAPTAPATHWKQTAFYLREPVEGGCEVSGKVVFEKHESFSRGYRVSFDLHVPGRKARSEGYELR